MSTAAPKRRAAVSPRCREQSAGEICTAMRRLQFSGGEDSFCHHGGEGAVRAARCVDLRGGILRSFKKNGDIFCDGRYARAHNLAHVAALDENIAFPAAAIAAADELKRMAEQRAGFGERSAGDADGALRSGQTNGIFHDVLPPDRQNLKMRCSAAAPHPQGWF